MIPGGSGSISSCNINDTAPMVERCLSDLVMMEPCDVCGWREKLYVLLFPFFEWNVGYRIQQRSKQSIVLFKCNHPPKTSRHVATAILAFASS